MEGDFSRSTFRPDKRYSAVLAQQGRIHLDADANEQAAIQLHLARTLTSDLIGRHGGPEGADGFRIEYVPDGDQHLADLKIGAGRYYVDGVLVDATRPVPLEAVPSNGHAAGAPPASAPPASAPEPEQWTYWDQPDAYRDAEVEGHRLPDSFPFLVYLKVRERLVTALQDPEIRESALGAAMPDTAARSQVTWQVLALGADTLDTTGDPAAEFEEWVAEQNAVRGLLAARSEKPARVDGDPCVLAPDSRFRGAENQLYRVEVHRGGTLGPGTTTPPPTFKWSRENASVAFPIDAIDGTWVTLAALGRDDKLDLHVGDWTEVSDDAAVLTGTRAPLLQVEEVDVAGRGVRLSGEPAADRGRIAARHPVLRRWDHRRSSARGTPDLDGGALVIQEGRWLALEDGVQVWFRPQGTYRAGDYWLIPARTLTGEVEWRRDAAGRSLLSPPDGVQYHYAPLAWIVEGGKVQDLRRLFAPLTRPPAGTAAAGAQARGKESADPAGGRPAPGTGDPSGPQGTAAAGSTGEGTVGEEAAGEGTAAEGTAAGEAAGEEVADAPTDEPRPPAVDATAAPTDGPQDVLPQEPGSSVETEVEDDEDDEDAAPEGGPPASSEEGN